MVWGHSSPAQSVMSEASAPAISLRAVSKRYGTHLALHPSDLEIAEGEFFCLLGPSGCGKTTLLRLVGGYLAASGGSVHINGQDVTSVALDRRNIGMVFQSYALFPHMTARQNVDFGLLARRIDGRERARRVASMLERVGLDAAAGDRLPAGLSGGEQQRVALARALVIEPQLLLLDEPLASLDRRLREAMRSELKELHQRTGVTTMMVTHDQEDALYLASRIGIMTGGRLLQVGTPEALYHRPACAEVARFLGDANLLVVTAVGDHGITLGAGLIASGASLEGAALGASVMVRPEDIVLRDHADRGVARATVQAATFLGADCQIRLRLHDGNVLIARTRKEASPRWPVGGVVHVGITPGTAWPIPQRAEESVAT
jgi:ABC-type Fe3+/spermidine/putrescine transport system ATPase subunit